MLAARAAAVIINITTIISKPSTSTNLSTIRGVPRPAGRQVARRPSSAWIRNRLQQSCDVFHVNPPLSWICIECNSSLIPFSPLPLPLRSKCKWCKLPTELKCPSCSVGIHFGTQCSHFFTGTNNWYRTEPLEWRWLCPDCLSQFALAVRHGPVRPAPLLPNPTVDQIMDNNVNKCNPGAGHIQAHRFPNHKALQKLILARLKHSVWIPINRICTILNERRNGMYTNRPPAFNYNILGISNAMNALAGNEEVWLSPDKKAVSIRRPSDVNPPHYRSRRFG